MFIIGEEGIEDTLPEAEATDLDLLEVLELTATDFYKK